jgi:hypothetical protein
MALLKPAYGNSLYNHYRPVVIESQEELERLADGAVFINKADGKRYRKTHKNWRPIPITKPTLGG